MKGVFTFFLTLISLHNIYCQSNYQQPELRSIQDSLYKHHPKVNYSFSSSNLPIVVITLNEKMKSKSEDTRVSADMKIIWDRNGLRNNYPDTTATGDPANPVAVDYNGKIEIKYRGNSSYYNSDKKPFAVKTVNEKGKKLNVSILGMGADSDWALLAPFGDKSLIRDILVFDLMKNGNMEYVPTGRYCEVVLNGVYQGIYIMAARVRTGEHRVNIPEPENAGDELTGGYLLEIDRNDGDDGFFSKHYNLDLNGDRRNKTYYQHKSPDGDDYAKGKMDEQRKYIENHVHEFEAVMASDNYKDKQTGYHKYLNIPSVLDYFVAQEFSRNTDGYRLSTPIYKKRDSVDPRFHMSIWDLNISLGNSDHYGGWSSQGWINNFNLTHNEDNYVPFWFKKLLEDTEFKGSLKKRWGEVRNSILSDRAIESKIDSLVALLDESQARNFDIWPILGKKVWPNVYWGDTWQKEINYLKSYIQRRVSWLDSQWLTESPENLLSNSGFEEDLLTNYPSSWEKSNNNCGHSDNAYSGQKSMSFRGDVTMWQTLCELEPGLYNLEFWARTEGYPMVTVNIRKNGGPLQFLELVDNDYPHYIKYVVENIEITEGNWDIVFQSKREKMHLDDVKFYKVKNYTGIKNDSKTESSVKVRAHGGKAYFNISSPVDGAAKIEVYTTSGIKVYENNKIRLDSGHNTIECDITSGKGIYLYRVTCGKQSETGKFSL